MRIGDGDNTFQAYLLDKYTRNVFNVTCFGRFFYGAMMASAFTDRFDGAQFGRAMKGPVVAVTNAAITLSGEQTVNSVAVTAAAAPCFQRDPTKLA